jgi:hypothetical protein
MNVFFVGLITTFITLVIAAAIIKFPKDYGKFFMASVTYGGLSAIPIPIPLLDIFAPPIGMYMVLIGTNYQSHKWVVNLCIVSFIVNAAILLTLIRLTK